MKKKEKPNKEKPRQKLIKKSSKQGKFKKNTSMTTAK